VVVEVVEVGKGHGVMLMPSGTAGTTICALALK